MALITSFLVDGVQVAAARLRDQSLSCDKQINGRSVLECALIDKTLYPTAPYIPTVRDTVYLEIGGVPVFGGILWAQRTGNIAGPGRGVKTEATFTDYKALLDRVYFNGPIPAGTLASQLAPLITNMAAHGITLSGSQEAGPTMIEQGFNFLTIRECLDALSAQSVLSGNTWIYTISPTGVFRMYEAGTQTCPFNLSESVGNYRTASWALDLNSYVNNIWTRYGPTGLALISQTFTGDNSTTSFALSQPLIIAATGVAPSGYVTVTRSGPAVTNENIDAEPITGPAQWHYDAVTNTLIQDAGEPVLNTGETVLISYYVLGPFSIFEGDDAEYAEFGPFTDVISMPEVTDPTIAQTTLSAELARRLGLQKKLTVLTEEAGAEPFQTITCTMPSLEVSGDYLITEVTLVEVAVNHNGGSGEREFAFELQCVEGNRYRGNWELFWRPDPRTQNSTGLYTPPPTVTPEEDCVELWADDFNSGAALSADYTGVSTVTKTAGIGPDASQAVETTGSLGDFAKSVSPSGLTGSVRFDSKTVDVGEWYTIFSIVDVGSFIVSFDRNDNTPGDNTLEIYGRFPSFGILTSIPGFWEPSTWASYRFDFKFSSDNGVTWNADAFVRIYKNAVLVYDSGLIEMHYGGAPGASPLTWDEVYFSPQGQIDNLVICDNAVTTSVTSSSVSPSGSVSPTASPSVSPSASVSPSPSPSGGNSPSVSPSSSVSASISPSGSTSPSSSASASVSPSSSVSSSTSRSASASLSPSSSVSRSPSASLSPSSSASPSSSTSPSSSDSPSASPSAGAGFPAIVGHSSYSGGTNSSHALTMPAGVATGDLLMVFTTTASGVTFSVSAGTGWAIVDQIDSASGAIRGAIFWKVADGSDALSVGISSARALGARIIRVLAGTFDAATPFDQTSATPATGANPDPPNHTPSGGADDYLWIAVRHGSTAATSAAPTNYDDLRTASTGANATLVSIAERELNASSEDPGVFTAGSSQNVVRTVAIHPV